MSRARRREVVTFTDEQGRPQEHITTLKDPPPLAAVAPPRRSWLVEVHDPAQHLVAVLSANAGLEPLVFEGSTGSPSFVLTPDGLRGALVVKDLGEPRSILHMIGTPRTSILVGCPTCRVEFHLNAAELSAMRASKPGRPRRLILGAAHSVSGAQR